MNARLAVSAAIGCAIAVACFSERSAGPSSNLADVCRVPVSVIDSMHFLIAIKNFEFHPDSISVPPGATVTWVNCDEGQEPHTSTSDNAVWDSPDISVGGRFSHTYPAQGSFPYHCTPHPFMLGKIIVE